MAAGELNLTSKSKPVILRGIRALVPQFQESWGDLAKFKSASVPILQRESGSVLAGPKEPEQLAELAYRTVMRLRAQHFRHIAGQTELDNAFKSLDPSMSSANAPALVQGCLWVAHRLQVGAQAYLRSADGQANLVKAETALSAGPQHWTKALGDGSPGLDRLESLIAGRVLEALGSGLSRFNAFALAGHLLERARSVARQLPALPDTESTPHDSTPVERMLDELGEGARVAELNEARLRFAKLTAAEAAKRFDAFKPFLLRVIVKVAPYAAISYEALCQAIEALLYPYPAQLEWLRAFIKPLYQNASQSTLFDGKTTVKAVNQRYEAIRQSKLGNPVVVELAKAFALVVSKTVDAEQQQAFLKDLDLVGEFHWPATLNDVRTRWSHPS